MDVKVHNPSVRRTYSDALLVLRTPTKQAPTTTATQPQKQPATMSNSVWIRWMDSISNEWLFDKVTELHADADISDLRKSFVAQQALSVSPAAVKVRETENGETLQPDQKLTDYFVSAQVSDSKAAAGSGKSKDSALFCTLPSPPKLPPDIERLLPLVTLPSSSTTTVSLCRSLRMPHVCIIISIDTYASLCTSLLSYALSPTAAAAVTSNRKSPTTTRLPGSWLVGRSRC